MNHNAKTPRPLSGASQEVHGGTAPTVAQDKRSREQAAREVRATEGWPPVAIPGRPGWFRHLIDGRQVDQYEGDGPWGSD